MSGWCEVARRAAYRYAAPHALLRRAIRCALSALAHARANSAYDRQVAEERGGGGVDGLLTAAERKSSRSLSPASHRRPRR